jgi:hypothetical protein
MNRSWRKKPSGMQMELGKHRLVPFQDPEQDEAKAKEMRRERNAARRAALKKMGLSIT